tara:strand:- start:1732 stop:2208 length:477 start_codon:yes stop_codon:yes gene_type:complete
MLRTGLGMAAVTFVCDRFTKWLVLDVWNLSDRNYEVAPFFNIVTVWNTGVSFGMFQSHSSAMPYLLSGLALAIVLALFVWLKRAENMFIAVSLGLIIGGAIGNTFDRLTFGAVFDFLDFHVLGYHWPAFNLADSAIVVGVLALLYDGLVRSQPDDAEI